MFCNFCKSMASCVMAFILLTGCAERGRTIETAVRTGSPGESVLWSGLQDESQWSDEGFCVSENGTGEGSAKQKDEHAADDGSQGEDTENREDAAGKSGGDTGSAGNNRNSDDASVASGFYVDVCGAVNRPGVVRVPEGARVFEAIEKAGGLTADADARYINRARKLTDGEQIYVPSKEETDSREWQFRSEGSGGSDTALQSGAGSGGDAAGVSADGKVNINTADSATLQTLTGIGESRAEAIILYRETNGAFETIEDIMKVTGIKNALFNNIKNDITV